METGVCLAHAECWCGRRLLKLAMVKERPKRMRRGEGQRRMRARSTILRRALNFFLRSDLLPFSKSLPLLKLLSRSRGFIIIFLCFKVKSIFIHYGFFIMKTINKKSNINSIWTNRIFPSFVCVTL